MSLLEYDQSLRPMGVAYAIAINQIDGMHGTGIIKGPDRLLGAIFEDAGEGIIALWRKTRGKAKPLKVKDGKIGNIEIFDLMGRMCDITKDGEIMIGYSPIYIKSKPTKVKELIKALGLTVVVSPCNQ